MSSPRLQIRETMKAADQSIVRHIRRLAARLVDETDEQLLARGLALKYDASTGRSIERLIPEAFALVCESARRTVSMVPYNVQIIGAIRLARGQIAEMKTGEGKTLTATMPVYLHALASRGAHVVTVNDYLAARDLEIMGPIYRRLGLTTGQVLAESSPAERTAGYACDITYGTAKEFGFDFLRDRLTLSTALAAGQTPTTVQRPLHFALIDEVDSVLIDEARTPLIIGIEDGSQQEIDSACSIWAARHQSAFVEGADYEYKAQTKQAKLTRGGIQRLRSLPQDNQTRRVPLQRLFDFMENAIKVNRDFQREQHYTIRDDKVAIVDEFTGRIAEGRQWQRGIHQAVEAKEGLMVSNATRQGATVTMQSFFRMYPHFAGMSGTVCTSGREFKKVYRKRPVPISTHRPIRRSKLPTKIFASAEAKLDAVVVEVQQQIDAGRAVLIGSRSIETSQQLSKRLRQQGIAHDVLNANEHAREAEIIRDSGHPGRVTVATNMAGRGADFLLSDAVRDAGGLHVILTEMHESQRIDWQLIGRGSRQGQPGSFRIMLAIDDELIESGLGPDRAARLRSKFANLNVLPRSTMRWFRLAQRKTERRHLTDRMILLKQDQQRQERHFEMGQDPWCDVVEG